MCKLAYPVQVVSVLMAFYRQAAPRPLDKARFFGLLCRDFGTQRAPPSTALFCQVLSR